MVQTETEKNLDDIEMMDYDKHKQSTTDNTDEIETGIERQERMKEREDENDFVYTKKEWGMKYQPMN